MHLAKAGNQNAVNTCSTRGPETRYGESTGGSTSLSEPDVCGSPFMVSPSTARFVDRARGRP